MEIEEKKKCVPVVLPPLLQCMATPTIQMSPLQTLSAYADDVDMLKLVRVCTYLYHIQRPHVVLRHELYVAKDLLEMRKQHLTFPHVQKVSWGTVSDDDPFESTAWPYVNYIATGYNNWDTLVSVLPRSPKITFLNMSMCDIRDSNLCPRMDFFTTQSSLTHLDVSDNLISAEDMGVVAALLLEPSRLRYLNVRDNQIEGDAMRVLLNAFETNVTLETLILSKNPFTEQGICKLFEIMGKNTTLRTLDLRGCTLGWLGLEYCARMLLINKCLTNLNVYGVENTSMPTGETWVKALTLNKTLTQLDLGSANVQGPCVSTLASSLRINTTLTCLSLTNNPQLGPLESLTRALRTNKTLVLLELGNVNMTLRDIHDLSFLLTVNTTLRDLDISRNHTVKGTLDVFSKSLSTNKTLKRLHLRACGIEATGATLFAETLQVNTGLLYVDMSNNPLQQQGADTLLAALLINTTLQSLHLRGCSIQELKVAPLMLEKNKTLTDLQLGGNSLPSLETALSFTKGLLKNTTLTRLELRHQTHDVGTRSTYSTLVDERILY